jgi:ABC-type proline/glycine betaine transport system ATPase subunit
MIDSLAQKYGLLPTQVIREATTYDLHVHIIAESYRDRQRAKASGNSKALAESYSQNEINEVWSSWQNSRSATKPSERT